MKKTFILFSLITALLFSSCSSKASSANSNKLKILVSINPLKEMTEKIGGDKVEIDTIISPGLEVHDYELTAKDIIKLNSSNLFIYNGLNLESFKDKLLSSSENKNLYSVEASKGISVIKTSEGTDPHIWISPACSKIIAGNIKDALIKNDSKNKAYYEKNYSEFIKSIDSLYNKYKPLFSGLNKKSFVTGHAAFAYFCRDFNLTQNSVEDVFASGEPSAKKLAELTDYCRKNEIKTIFVEDLVSPKVSETLAKEVGAKTVKINTFLDGDDYIGTQKDNLEKIYESLK
ncbi:MAG: zinc ABC transporter substrate-binding protein [Bacillota bacterium]|nr:zinc ABC transporter substrate-binding protein [Bacillota bacterium]